jgi:MFS family permease
MKRKNYGFYFAALVVSTLLGAWLTGLLGFLGIGDPLGSISGWGSLLWLVGFLMFISSLGGLVSLISRLLPPISREEMVAWNETRKQGRSSFLRRAASRGIVLGFVISSLVLLTGLARGKPFNYGVWSYALLVPIYVFANVYGAYRTWNNNERAYEKLMHSNSSGETSMNLKQN